MIIKKIIASLVSVMAVLTFAVTVYAADSTVVITGNTSAGENQPGWMFNRDASTSTPYEFNTNQASIGTGSLYVLPIGATAANKFIAENFINAPIASIDDISYDFRIGSGGESTDEEHFYMNVYANFGVSDDTKFYDCRYNVVPTTGSTSAFTTVTFDPNQAYPVTQHGTSPATCPAVPADMDTLSSNSTIRVFAINVGDTSTSDEGLDGYLDKVVVDTTSDVMTYDFEPAVGPPTHKDQCKNEGWMTFNNPSFNNQGKCINYVERNNHRVRGNIEYMANGLLREAEFDMETANNKGNFHYKDGNRNSYRVKVSEVNVDGDTGYFAGEVTKASNPAWVGQWLFVKVVDGTPDMTWGSFTDESTAVNGVMTKATPTDGPFTVTRGNIRVN